MKCGEYYTGSATQMDGRDQPTQWLTDVLERMPDHSIQKLHELLPAHWQPGQRNTSAILTQYSLSS